MRVDTEIVNTVIEACKQLQIEVLERGFTGKSHHKLKLRNKYGITRVLTTSASCSDSFGPTKALAQVRRFAEQTQPMHLGQNHRRR